MSVYVSDILLGNYIITKPVTDNIQDDKQQPSRKLDWYHSNKVCLRI